jgi:tetratricopeptide (TPR) repeat protein
MSLGARKALWSLGLMLCALLAYGKVGSFEYLHYDDYAYVTQTPQVLEGLSLKNLVWAFSTYRTANFHPLTWLSLQADATFLGNEPGARHVVNAVLHAANAALLFLLLAAATGRLWPALFAAALFALHPVNVESVAWVAERKNVLCAFFWLLASLAYLAWTRRPSLGRYGLLCALFLLSMLAKPLAVTFPCALLLLDYWPLNRFFTSNRGFFGSLGARILEKAPLFALTAASCVITYIAQNAEGAVEHRISLAERCANALIGYAAYLLDLLAPVDLEPMYPLPKTILGWNAAGAALLLLGLSALLWRARRRLPSAWVGWLWYLGTLVPMIGLVQVGMQARADRYLYVSAWGLFWLVGYGAAELPERFPAHKTGLRRGLSVAALAVLLALGLGTWRQSEIWRDSPALFQHMRVVEGHPGMLYNQALILQKSGRFAEAAEGYRKALAANPRHAGAANNLGGLLLDAGHYEEALAPLARALELEPHRFAAALNLGAALFELGRLEEAAAATARALELDPSSGDAVTNMGLILMRAGRAREALPFLRKALELDPGDELVRAALEAASQEK